MHKPAFIEENSLCDNNKSDPYKCDSSLQKLSERKIYLG